MLRRKRTRSLKKNHHRGRSARTVESLESRQLMAGHTAADCIDFEDLAVGSSYVVGDSFTADAVDFQARITGHPFQWSSGAMFAGGVATVESGNTSGHLGQDISVNNINLDFFLVDGPEDQISLRFGEFGGNLNLSVNGDFANFENFLDIDGAVLGGATINVAAGGTGQDTGVLQINGTVEKFSIGGQELWIDHVCRGIDDNPEPNDRLDFGDAPERPYPVTLANGGARHVIDPDVFLGNGVDAEPDGQPSPNANRDDAAVSDDEDGVQFLTPLIPGQMAQVEVVASVDGYLNAWIDFNRNGDWEPGTPEEIFSAQPLVAGVNVLNFMVPADAKPDPNEPTFSRWRFSTTDKILTPKEGSPTGATPNGEVEDHLAFIQENPEPNDRLDFGDLRDSYGTTLANNGARHLINPNVFLGTRIDAEPDGSPTFNALGDDLMTSDDEDGVRFRTAIVPGKVATVDVLSSADAKIDAWIDFNQNGTFEPSEQIAVSAAVSPGVNSLNFNVPKSAMPVPTRPTAARFRLSTNGGLGPRGMAKDGEVEDYVYLNGDHNNDLSITVVDVDAECRLVQQGHPAGDLNNDGKTNTDDMDYLVHNILGTTYGDANLDGRFNSTDLVRMFAAGEYEDGVPGNSTWADGDFNCDGEFDSGDLIKAFVDGGYTAAAVPQAVVPDLPDGSGRSAEDRQDRNDPAQDQDAGQQQRQRQPHQIHAIAVDQLFGQDDVQHPNRKTNQDARDRFFAEI